MSFDFLNQFWDSITDATSGTIDFFKNTGLAVAGALGSIFLQPLKIIVEFGLALGWVGQNLLLILGNLLQPFKFVYYFFVEILAKLQTVPANATLTGISENYINFLKSFPMFSTIQIVVSGGILIIGLFAFFRVAKL